MVCHQGSPASVWLANVVLFYVLMVLFTSVEAVKKKHCLQGDEPFFNATFCAYWNTSHFDWERAVQLCMLLGSQDTLVDVIPRAKSNLMEKFLREENLTNLWIPVNQPVANRSLKYELINRDGEFPVHWTGSRPQSADIPWTMESRKGSCVLLTSDPKNGLGLRMEDCSRRHSVMCITTLIYDDMVKDALAERERVLAKFQHPDPEPTLYFRYNREGNELYLRVDHPERVHQNSTKCYLEGAPLEKTDTSTVKLHPTKDAAEFLIYTKQEGYITCQARVSDSLQLVRTERILRRSTEEGQTYVLAIRYRSILCRKGYCDPADLNYIETVTRRVRDELRMKMHADSVHAFSDYYNINMSELSGSSAIRESLEEPGSDESEDDIGNVVDFPDGLSLDDFSSGRMEEYDPNLDTHDCSDASCCDVDNPNVLTLREAYIGPQTCFRNNTNVVITYRVQLPEEYVKDLSATIRTIVSAVNASGVLMVRSAEFCPVETKDGLTWPVTRTEHTAVPEGPCRHLDGVPVTRQCKGDFINGAYWKDPIGWSSGETCDESEREDKIQHLTRRNISSEEKLKKLRTVLDSEPRHQLKVSEIRAISEIFSSVTTEGLSGVEVPTIASITNSVILLSKNESGSGSLATAQEEFNTSNSILASLDNMLSGVHLSSDREMSVESQFATLVMDVDGSLWDSLSAIRGVATMKISNLRERDIQTLSRIDSLGYILGSDLVSAVLLPDSLFFNESSRHRLVINIFTSPELFGANSSSPFQPQHIISVTVNGTRQTLDGPLRLLFKKEVPSGLENPCVFWDFQANDNKGTWSSKGCELAEESKRLDYDVCMCGHLTHFTRLIQTRSSEEEEPAPLLYISIIGCSLSILGLCGIFVTAAVIPEWRKGTGKKLQLHFSMAVLMLMCSFLMLAAGGDHEEWSALCVASGVLSHFSLLAVYMWTLAIAWYQYRRLTDPLKALDHVPHYLLITALVAWGSPFTLCSVVLATDIDTYGPPHCYPYGKNHLTLVYIPVCFILVVNIVIFLLIVWSIFDCRKCVMKSDCQVNTNPLDIHRIKLRLISSLYLFVLLNLCWVFGFLGWEYLFCITATMQGVSLFLFFVILNKPTRERWHRLLHKRAVELRGLSSS
ncbi:adhesion G-protein coupled receptor G6 [Anabrus simplex]|uniref:adhesion G-protein coupled receptor G6 n=1 Tax=Anabrus simplex TaxID=316456 RepID=UPI0035A2CC26